MPSPSITPQEFVAKWRGDTRKERSVAQEHFIDLCCMLTNLYNQRPTWLDIAHTKLDRAALDAYGWPHDIADEEILARRLALNLERAAGQDGAVDPMADGDQAE